MSEFAMPRLILLLAALLPIACFGSPTGPDAVVGRPFELKAGATSALPDGSRLTFNRVQSDSRCPMDAICVWAGDASIAITIRPGNGAAQSHELHTQPTGSQITYGAYTIALTALAPYPRASQPTPADQYVATFVVTTR
jgi:hypothetical protein